MRNKFAIPKTGSGKVLNCLSCGSSFYVTPSRLIKNINHHCSKSCSGKTASKISSRKVIRKCLNCSCDIFYKQSASKEIANPTCSRACKDKYQKKLFVGANNPKSRNLSESESYFWDRCLDYKRRAKGKNMDFDLDFKFLENLFNNQGGKCHYSGSEMIKISKSDRGGNAASYNVASLDRIDNSRGYTKDNVVWCLNCVNMLKAHHGVGVLEEVVGAMAKKRFGNMVVKIKKIANEAVIPVYQTDGASGFDLHALDDLTIDLWDSVLVRTGLSFEIPAGYEIQIRPRSGLSLKTGLRVCNSPGTVDEDYTGEICVIMQLTPHSSNNVKYTIKRGDRIAQAVLCPVSRATFQEATELSETERGSGGFGSTGA